MLSCELFKELLPYVEREDLYLERLSIQSYQDLMYLVCNKNVEIFILPEDEDGPCQLSLDIYDARYDDIDEWYINLSPRFSVMFTLNLLLNRLNFTILIDDDTSISYKYF